MAGETKQRNLNQPVPSTVFIPLPQVAEGMKGMMQQRFNLSLLTLFAALGLTLAAIGIYGVMAYATAQRTHEIGLRNGIGNANARRAETGRKAENGAGSGRCGTRFTGIIGADALAENLLFGVSATDPLTFVVLTLLLLVVALAACWIPAWRATKVDPMIALRNE